MSNSIWQKIDEIFPLVADLPAGERDAALRELCAGDETLRREILGLLAADEKADDFCEDPVFLPKSLSHAFGRARTNAPTDSLAGAKVGAYRLERKIGAGGMGAVYLAARDDGAFEKKVAVKFVRRGVDTDFNLRRFRQERQVLAALEHPNIARLIDGGSAPDGLPFFVMEYVEGKTLFEYCDGRALDLTARLEIFRQICAAVHYAHEKQIIHRDLKPGNILVTEAGAVKLLDFGIAKIFDEKLLGEPVAHTDTFLRQMTPEYASPEQIKGEAVSPATDVYSLGVVLYELATGERPYKFVSRAPHEIARVICEEKIRLPRYKFEIPNAEDLNFIILKALRKKPSERFSSVGEFDAHVARLLKGLPVLTDETRLGFYDLPAHNSAGSIVSLAVAPFQILPNSEEKTPKTDDEFLGIGLADALTTKLSGVRQIAVRPTNSVLRQAALDAEALGKALSADFVLTGRILRGGERIRVAVQLLNVADNSVLWADAFDDDEIDIFLLLDSISERVAASLVPHLTLEEREILHLQGTKSEAAYKAYLRGRVFFHNYTFGGISAAENCFAEAIALDPDFALAHCGLADFYNLQTVFGLTANDTGFARAKESALKAVELDPNLAEAHTALAFTTWSFDWDFAKAENLFKKALRLNPNYARAREWYAFLLSLNGRHADALTEIRRAEQLDPQSPAVASMYSLVLYNARRYEDALAKARRALELDPDYYIALQSLGWICPPLGRFDEAIKSCRRAVLICDAQALNKFSLALALVDAGQTKEARAIAAELASRRAREIVPAYYLALLNAYLGEDEEAFRWFDEAIEERGYYTLRLRVEPRLDRLRGDARFAALLERIEPLNGSAPASDSAARAAGKDTEAKAAYRRARAAAYAYTFEGVAASEKHFQEAIALAPDFAPAYSGLADFYNFQTIAGLVPPAMVQPAAKRAALKALELDPNSSEAHVSLAFATWAFDWDFAEAERLYRQSIALDPKNVKAREWFSYLLSSAGRHDEAVAEMQRAERLDPHSPTVLAMFGLCFYYARRYEEGYEKIKRALELDPDYYLALQSLGWICPPLGRFDEAVTGARRAAEIGGELAFTKFSLALALIAAGQPEEAREIAAELAAKRLETFAPAYFLAAIYANLGERETALRWLDEAAAERGYWSLWIKVDPRFDALCATDRRFADRLAQLKLPESAPATTLLFAPQTGEIKVPPRLKTRATVFAAACAVLVFIGIYFGAISGLYAPQTEVNHDSAPGLIASSVPAGKAQQTNDEVADGLYQAGKQQLETRSFDGINQAVKLFGEATRRDPNFALAFSALSDAYILLGDRKMKEAGEAYRLAEENAVKALALDPDLIEARISLAMTRYRRANAKEAERHFLRAIELDPRQPRARHWYSVVLFETGRFEEALREIEIAAEIEPRSAIIQAHLAACYMWLNRLDEALVHINRAIELESRLRVAYLTKSLLLQFRGDYEAAMENFRQAQIVMNGDENEPFWLMMQAHAHAARQRRAEGSAFLNRLFKTPLFQKSVQNIAPDVALFYHLLGDDDKTFEWLKKFRLTEKRELRAITFDPRFVRLHTDPRFQDLIEEWKKQADALENKS